MSVFAGIVNIDSAVIAQGAENYLIKAIARGQTERCELVRSSGAVFVQRKPKAGNWRKGDLRVVAKPSGLFAAFARLDNRDELAEALDIPQRQRADWPDAILVSRMFERFGDAGVARCLGSFAFAGWDADRRRLTLGRDCLGNRLLLFHRTGQTVIFCNDLGTLLAIAEVPRELDEIALADLMVLNRSNPRRTLYRGIERTPCGTLLTMDPSGIAQRRYWSPDFAAPPPYRKFEDYVERARELFDQAVLAATADSRDIAISTSGGLDSSAIAATVAQLGRADRITCYTLVPPEGTNVIVDPNEYPDESGKVQALVRMHPALNLRLLAPDGLYPIDTDDTQIFVRRNLPVLGASSLGWRSMLIDAVKEAGHPLLLHGARGNYGLSWTGESSLLVQLQNHDWGGFAADLVAIARNNKRGLARTLVSNVLLPGGPPGLRRLVSRLRGKNRDDILHRSALNRAFVAEHDLEALWREEGHSLWRRPPAWQPARHRARFLFENHRGYSDHSEYLDDACGYDLRDPHADRRLLEFALSVPEPLYRRNGVARAFARSVFADRLPPEILDEQRRGDGGAPWFERLTLKRQDMTADIERLEGSAMARRLLDLPRLKQLLDDWPKDEHAAHARKLEYNVTLVRGVHLGRFIRWVEGGNT